MNEIKIAKSIQRKRLEKGLTQDELASYVGVTKASVSKWEKGQSYPDIMLLPQLATYFDMSIDELMGYTPQMSKKDIKALYKSLSAKFSELPFDEVMVEVRSVIKKYYSCYPLLMQIVVLYLNHFDLAKDTESKTSILEEALSLCIRVKTDASDIHIIQDANSTQAILYLILRKPNEVIDILEDSTLRPFNQDEMTLASAYEMKGDISASKRALQITEYQHVLYVIGSAVKLLPLYKDNQDRFEEILTRNLTVADTFNLMKLHPNAYIQLSSTTAFCLAELGDYKRSLYFLTKCMDAFENFNFPILLHGDEYFDLLDDWFDDFYLGDNTPRDGKLIKKSLVEMLKHPALTPMFEMNEYKNILARAESIKEE